MVEIDGIFLYESDEEIVDVLSNLPPMDDYGGKNILKFMQENTEGENFGTVFRHNDMVYTVYKFDMRFFKPDKAGLLLTVSKMDKALDQLDFWHAFKASGFLFEKSIFSLIENYLTATGFTNNF